MLKLLAVFGCLILTIPAEARPHHFPWDKAGLTQRQAAAHLLNRFTFGPRPGDVDSVVQQGLESWFDGQLMALDPDDEVNRRLQGYPSLRRTDRDINDHYINADQIVNRALKDLHLTRPVDTDPPDVKKTFQEIVHQYAVSHDLHDFNEIRQDLLAQKLIRAVYGRNQLWEVISDFWYNHFNVSITTDARYFVLSYERDIIRPYGLGPFQRFLIATSKHPAMLAYLNNNRSVANADKPTTDELRNHRTTPRRNKRDGLNENYAREVMELHTLGVDGGYAQSDVTEVARALTGWTTLLDGSQRNIRQAIEQGKAQNAVVQGDFLFRPDQHDAGAKRILGHNFAAGGGLEEGEAVLAMLAQHPSTARFVSRKLAVRFVADQPPASLVEHMAATYRSSQGQIREVLWTMVESPEFWAPEARVGKVKSPFELMASSLRALSAEVDPGQPLYGWLDRMGEPLYSYIAPTGYPDRADAWINEGTLTYRINYAFNVATGRIKGVKVNLDPLASPSQPAQQRMEAMAEALMPGKDLEANLPKYKLLAEDPVFLKKMGLLKAPPAPSAKPAPVSDSMGQWVGVLMGSPEFQRR
jgi:uncharacterized protein (DUF1800 family)